MALGHVSQICRQEGMVTLPSSKPRLQETQQQDHQQRRIFRFGQHINPPSRAPMNWWRMNPTGRQLRTEKACREGERVSPNPFGLRLL